MHTYIFPCNDQSSLSNRILITSLYVCKALYIVITCSGEKMSSSISFIYMLGTIPIIYCLDNPSICMSYMSYTKAYYLV